MFRRSLPFLAALLLLPAPVALAQGPQGAQSVIADPDGLNREVMSHADMRGICWERGEPRGADWVAELDPGYRRGVMSRYLMEETGSGWRWLPAELAARTDVRAATSVEGYTDRSLVVDLSDADVARARLLIDGPLSAGEVEMEWTVPPARLCMADELDLEARARVTAGSPGAHGMLFVVPLTPELREVQGPDVKACTPTDSTLVDSDVGLAEDMGRCRRALSHLRPDVPWALMVKLPEFFYVVYPYEPRGRR